MELEEHLKLLTVELNSFGMREYHIVNSNKRLHIRVTGQAIAKRWGTMSRWKPSQDITHQRVYIWLIYCHPILHSIPKFLEAYLCEIYKIFPIYTTITR